MHESLIFLYQEHFISPNIYALIHLHEDYGNNGSLGNVFASNMKTTRVN